MTEKNALYSVIHFPSTCHMMIQVLFREGLPPNRSAGFQPPTPPILEWCSLGLLGQFRINGPKVRVIL